MVGWRVSRTVRHLEDPVKQHRSQQQTASGPTTAPSRRAAGGRGNAAAAEKMSGTGPWPVPQDIADAFGVDFSHIQIVVSNAPARIGAQAFAQGNQIHFLPGVWSESSPQARHILCHELVHILQQARGTAGSGGGVNADPKLEAEAERIAAQAAAGQKVNLGSGTPRGRSNAPMQPYGLAQRGNQTLRVSDDGTMAVAEGYPNHDFWAERALISSADSALKAKGSAISLKAGGSATVIRKPRGGRARLIKVVPTNSRTNTSGDSMMHYADCGRSTRDVMGGNGEQWGQIRATYTEEGQVPVEGDWGDKLSELWGGATQPGPVRKETGAGHRPGDWKAEIFDAVAGGEHAYRGLDEVEQRKIDEAAGINDFANPEIGEGFTMSSGGAPIAGFEDNTWNFHFAGLVMKSGGDFVTLENFSVSKPDVSNTDWTFDMYGPAHKEGQTFHDQHTDTNQHGETPTTLAVKSS